MYHLYFIIRDTYMTVAVRSKEWACDSSLAGITGSNPTACMGFWELCFPGTGLCVGPIPPPGDCMCGC